MAMHYWSEDFLEKEEELCRALSDFSIKMKQLIKHPKLQVRFLLTVVCKF